jgi:hypothetical protein
MIEQTVFDLRLAEHRARAAEAGATAWMLERPRVRRTAREALASALIAWALRLDPPAPGAIDFDHPAPGTA